MLTMSQKDYISLTIYTTYALIMAIALWISWVEKELRKYLLYTCICCFIVRDYFMKERVAIPPV